MRSQGIGRRYLAAIVILLAILFFVVGTLGPAHRSPFYALIVPPPAAVALILGILAWRSEKRGTGLAASALALLLFVLVFSHLLPRTMG